MAAFEKVSNVKFKPYNRESEFDFRTARLPPQKKWKLGPLGPNDYNPLEHRVPKQSIPVWMAYFNVIRTGFGAGMLGFPVAISRGGVIIGPIIAAFTAMLIIHTQLMLLKCLNEISRRICIPIISYRYGFRIALLHGPPITHRMGRSGPTIIAVFMLMSQIGICTAFLQFTADTLRDMMEWTSTRKSILCLFFPYLILELSMRNLKIISYVTIIGFFLNVAGFFLMLYYIFLSPHGEFNDDQIGIFPTVFCFGTYLFNLSVVGVALSVDKNLHQPTAMTRKLGVITVGIGVPAVIAIIFGVLGYWSFGALDENLLRSLPYDDITSIITSAFYMVAVGFAYPIQCYPGIQIILEVVRNHDLYDEPSEATMKLVECIATPGFVVVTFLVAYLLPIQTIFVPFVGNLCTTMLSLVFPALMDICLMYPKSYGQYNVYLIKDVLIIILGVMAFAFGVVLNGYNLYIKVQSLASPNVQEFI